MKYSSLGANQKTDALSGNEIGRFLEYSLNKMHASLSGDSAYISSLQMSGFSIR